MTDNEREAARILEPLRHFDPAGSSNIDVDRAVRSGRRTVLGRQVAGAVACLVAVLGVAAVFTLPDGQTPAGDSGAFGVTTQEFAIGSAAGFTPSTYETGVNRQRAALTAPGLEDTGAVVTMYARGGLPVGTDWEPAGDSAPEVKGHAAWWLDDPVTGDGAVELTWQWENDAWGFVRLTGPDATRDRAHKVALSVEPGADIDVATPVRLSADIAAKLKPTGILRSIGDHGRLERIYQVRYAVSGASDAWVRVGIRQPEPETGDVTTVGNRPAHVEEDRVTFLDGSGIVVEVSDPSVFEMPLTELAASVEIDPEFDWTSPPPLTSSSSSSSGSSSSGSSPSTGTPTGPSKSSSPPSGPSPTD